MGVIERGLDRSRCILPDPKGNLYMLNPERGRTGECYPQFLPDGRHFLYYAVYAKPGYLLFLRQGVLLAQPFDLKKMELTGEPLPQAERVATGFTGWAYVSVADDGTIAYGTDAGRDKRMTWVDRSGKETELRTRGGVGPLWISQGMRTVWLRRRRKTVTVICG